MGSSAANTNGRTWEGGRAPTSTAGHGGGTAPATDADGGAPERARAGLAGQTESRPTDDTSSREAGERSRRTHHTDEPSAPTEGDRDPPGVVLVSRDGEAPVLVPIGAATRPLVTPVLEQLEVDLPTAGPRDAFVQSRTYLALKRAMDVAIATLALVVLAPVFALLALAIKLEDGGPVFFFQTRVGKNGRSFRFWKFRSMCVDAEARREAVKAQAQTQHEAVSDRLRFKMSADPRVTRVGRLLRRFSLDELPQLVNVLTGDMSLVGPRPPIPEEVAQYSPRHMRRLEVEQGITCLWQVSGRNLLSFEQQVELDIEYARRRSLTFDVLLLARTVPAVLTGRGAC